MPDRPAVRFDPAAAYPEVGAVRSALAGGDWAAGRAVLDAAAPTGRTALLAILGAEPSLSGAVPADPADSTAAALLGFHRIEAARRRPAGLHDGLRAAERGLTDAVARTPGDPALWVARLRSARGLELGPAETRRRYARLAEIDPHHQPGQSELLRQLCPTWPEARAFARRAALAAPAGGPHGVLIAEVHLERRREPAGGRRWLASADVGAEIDEAARRSVFHPGFARTPGWVGVVSTFAVVFSLRGDYRSAAAAFAALGPLATEHPWAYLGDPAAAVRKYRTRAARPGAGRIRRWAAAGLTAAGRRR